MKIEEIIGKNFVDILPGKTVKIKKAITGIVYSFVIQGVRNSYNYTVDDTNPVCVCLYLPQIELPNEGSLFSASHMIWESQNKKWTLYGKVKINEKKWFKKESYKEVEWLKAESYEVELIVE